MSGHRGGIVFVNYKTGEEVEVRGITVDLTGGAASALNSALGTKLFAGGLDLGTAAAAVRF